MYLAYLQNPLDLPGPEFLGLYILTLVLFVIIALVLRVLMRGRRGVAMPLLDLDPYETAYLMGAERQAIETAIGVLVQRKSLKVDASNLKLSTLADLSPRAHSLERAVYDEAARSGGRLESVRATASQVAKQLAVRLQALGLIFDEMKARTIKTIPALLIIAVTVFGAIKILIGISRGRPVGFLVILTILSLVIAIMFYRARLHRTPLGDQFVDRLKKKNAALEQTARTRPTSLEGPDLALALGLFGLGALAFGGGPLFDLRNSLRPHTTGASDWSSTTSCSGSSCSSSSCSSGCGGGGGCGGCGGS